MARVLVSASAAWAGECELGGYRCSKKSLTVMVHSMR